MSMRCQVIPNLEKTVRTIQASKVHSGSMCGLKIGCIFTKKKLFQGHGVELTSLKMLPMMFSDKRAHASFAVANLKLC